MRKGSEFAKPPERGVVQTWGIPRLSVSCHRARMFLRGTIREKSGKEHCYWSIVENKRITGGKVRQRYLSEINASQERAWRRSIEVLDEDADRPRTLALFPEN